MCIRDRVMAGWGGVGVPSGDARSSIVPEYGNDGRLLVFRLDGPGQVTIPARRDISIPEPPAMDYDQADLALGSRLYMERCNFCHGPLGFSTGVVPDLRRMDASVHEIFGDVVLRGARLAGGMPSFEDVLDEKDVRAIHAYVIRSHVLEHRATGLRILWSSFPRSSTSVCSLPSPRLHHH